MQTVTRFASAFPIALALLNNSIALPVVSGQQVRLNVALAHPTMLIDGTKGMNHVRIGLTGFELNNATDRTPINVAIVIDKSGSMQGEKIRQARNAALQAIDRLRDSDIVSIVTYDSSVRVLVPATKASDRSTIKERIKTISAGGNTALFAGVSKGAAEIRKFLDENRVNRIILLSDGLANVGPSSPGELEQLGESLIKEGISVSTMGLGLGYNEDLMSRLALSSSGNHVFIEDAENLVQVFHNEFDDVLSVVAQKLRIVTTMAEGVRPVKVLNYPADIAGQTVSIDLGQLYSRQERYFVVEVEVPFADPGSRMPVADVALQYKNMLTETQDRLTSSVEVRFTDDAAIAEKDIDESILSSCIIQIANERNRKATELRDAGMIDDARQLLIENATYLEEFSESLGRPELRTRYLWNSLQAERLSPQDWAANRKSMVELQTLDASQQSYRGTGSKSPESQAPRN